MTKRKLSKLLGKKLEYTATLEKYCAKKDKVLLTNIKHENKIYSEHSWVLPTNSFSKIKNESEVKFKAIACMYNDKFGIRKQGLTNLDEIEENKEEYFNHIEKEKLDAKFAKARQAKNYKKYK